MSSDLRVCEVEAIPVRVARNATFRPLTAHGGKSASEYVVLILRSHGGVVGLGEATVDAVWNGEDASTTKRLVDEIVGPALLGEQASGAMSLLEKLRPVLKRRPFLAAAIEMACLDLTGKVTGLRVVDLCGGALRDHLATKFVLPARAPTEVQEMAAALLKQDVRRVKVKVGIDVGSDIARVRAVRETLGDDASVVVDANEGWSYEQALLIIPRLLELGVHVVEQPLARDDHVRAAELRRRFPSIVVLADEAIWSASDIVLASRLGSADAVSIYPGKLGGLVRTLRAASLADALGLGVVYGSNLELGIGSAALAHCAAASPAVSSLVASDVIGPLYFDHPLVEDASFVTMQQAQVPDGPGLGVELSELALNSARIHER